MIIRTKITKLVMSAILSAAALNAQTVAFTPAGQGTDYMRYNVTTSTAANSGGLTGGFTMTGSAFNDLNMYILQFSFDGTSWNTDVSAMVATTGGLVAGGNGGRFTSTDGNAQISVSHEVLAAVSTWPGNDGSIRLRINESGTASYYPTSVGVTWPIDLTRPSISTSSIVSNNSTNTGYATTNDVITLSITASENLMNDGIYIFNGNISGLDFITQAGADATQWSFASTVTTHAEATVTYDIAYYDENYNLGVSSITSTTDGTTVIVDRTTPTLDVSITSNNSNNTSLAKEGDQLTLTISATETLHEAPTVSIMNEPNPTVSPPAQSRDYIATHSPTDANGDEEGTVTFSITGVKDRAGNAIASAVTATNDGTSVEFDITAPVVQTITSLSNNTYSTSRAKADDVVTVSFSSTEKIQIPTVLIAGEAAVESNANGDQVTWTATKTMDAEDSDDNIIDISIVYTDLAGNSGVTKTDNNLEANSAVDFDNTPPNEPGVTVSSSNTINPSYAIMNSIVSVDITSNEDLLDDTNGDEIPDGISNVRIAERDVTNIGVETLTRNNGTSFSAQVQLTGFETEEVVTYSFTMTDLTGNTRAVTANTSNILIDNVAPSITPVSIISNNATNTSYAKTDDVITLSFTSNEDLSSATGHTPTSTIGITAVTPSAITGRTEFASTLTTSNSMAEEQVGFTLEATDVAGNSVTVDAVTDGSSVTIDNSAPSVNYLRLSSSGAANTYAKAGEVVTLDFQSDEELSSISAITIFESAPDAAPTDLGNNTYRAQYTLQGTEDNGLVPFTLNFIDQAGNTLSGNLTALVDDTDGGVTYDDEAPTLDRVTITSSNSNSATLAKVDDVITFSITASEQIKAPQIVIAGRTGAGAATLSDDTNTDGLQIYTATYTMKQDDPEGVVAFTVDFQDLASNAGTQVIALTAEDLDGGVTFDKTPPFFNQTIGGEVGSVTISSNNANGNTK
ncbi:hypothetical protein OA955_00950 [Candidatus Marinimicrobia bacterium]|nr:hypothetical protein [Candidatus Neomarinimicrobiota bacterium]